MPVTLRLMTANLYSGRADPRHFGAVLDRMRPDVIVTQQMGMDNAKMIESRFPFCDVRLDPDSQRTGIASRFPAEFAALDLPWRSGSWAKLQLGSEHLVVAGVHLRNPIVFPWRKSVRIRRAQVEALLSWADDTLGDEPVVVAGDMNATRHWPTYRRMHERWDDLVVSGHDGRPGRPAATWGWRPGWPLVLRIDHVFGGGVRAVGTSVNRIASSDHAALTVDIDSGET